MRRRAGIMNNKLSRRDLTQLIEAKISEQTETATTPDRCVASPAKIFAEPQKDGSAPPKISQPQPLAPDLITLARAAGLWAQTTTNSDLARAIDVRRDKLRVVREFFAFSNKDLIAVTPLDVQQWQLWLESRSNPLKARTIYLYSAHLSSFFEWLRRQPEFRSFFPVNPVRAAFPKFPNPYESDGTRSLTDEGFSALWEVIELAARREFDVVALRDYAIFRFFAATGARRSEILNLNGNDVELSALSDGITFYSRTKGGTRVGKTITDPEVRAALLKYLKATNRLRILGKSEPLWLAHDRAVVRRSQTVTEAAAGDSGLFSNKRARISVSGAGGNAKRLTGHAFAHRMKIYAAKAGLPAFHLHQLRHTFARAVHEKTRSVSQTQEALGHRNMKTTEVYVPRIEIKADEHSQSISDRFRPRSR